MAGQGSARVTLKEIDLSQVRDPEQLPQGVPAAVVGPAKRGPAFVPKTFANMQKFGEVFGSMSEISKESNANRFGPLALNEWMRNAQAGTFVRTLGIGSSEGRMNDDKTVAGAGFVVGNKISYDNNNNLVVNTSASIAAANEVGALKASRTHFLGCFMKDASGSTFLQDAGVQTTQGAGSIKITLDNDTHIAAGSTLKIKYKRHATDPTLEDTATFTFLVGESTNNDRNIKADGSNTVVLTDLMNAINGTTQEDTGTREIKDSLTASLAGSTLTISSDHAALGSATNDIEVEFDMKSDGVITDINVGGKTASEANQTVRFGASGNTAAKFEVVMSDNPANAGILTFSLIQNDGDATLTDKSVEYKFLTALTDTAAGNDVVPNTYHVNTAGVTEIHIGANPVETLENLQAALARVASVGTISQHQGLVSSTLDRANNKLTITQKNLGDAGNSVVAGTGNITALTATNTTITAASNLVNARTSTTTTKNNGNFVTVFMFGGSDSAESKSLTLKLTGNAVVDDKLDISVQEVDDVDGTRTLHMLFKIAANTGNGSQGDPRHVKIGADLQETLYNIKNAILDPANKDETARIHLDVDAVVSDADDSLTITYKNNGARNDNTITNLQGGLRGDVISTVEVGEYATFTNPSGFSLVGNHGPKTVNFTGGGGAAAPVIRGLLMSPQGVVPAMSLDSENYKSIPTAGITVADVASGANLQDFGNGEVLVGYQIGAVSDDDEQSFKLILNGYSGSDAKVLDCSFNPDSVNYFANVLNTDPEKIEERGHYLHAHWDIDPVVAKADISGVIKSSGAVATADEIGFCMPTSGQRATPSASKPDFESFNTRFRTAKSPWFKTQSFGAESYNLFKLHSLDDGEAGNDRFRILISNIIAPENEGDWGSFDLTLEGFYSDPVSGEGLITWKRLSFDPDSKNFIGRVIGDKHMYYDFDRAASKQRLVEEGDFEVKNNYVRVELSELVKSGEIPSSSLPCAFEGYRTLNTAITNLFNEPGAHGDGSTKLLADNIFDGLEVLPLPFVKTITRASGESFEASEALSWGIKFAKKKTAGENNETSEIRFNSSIQSWTKFWPDMTDGVNATFGKDSAEAFSLEKIAVPDSSSIDWSKAEYSRSGAVPSGKTFITLGEAAKSGRNVKYLKFRCLMQGGFNGLDILNKEKAAMSSAAAFREASDENGDGIFSGATIQMYKRAIDVLADKSATELQLLAIPGIREPAVTNYAITACESRFDAMFVMDIEESDSANATIISSSVKPNVTQTISKFSSRQLDTSFAAAYFPDVISRRPSNGSPLQVPPSVCMLGVMSQNDTLADPWFAPAGLTRGRLRALNSKIQMNRDVLNDLYDADINPIYEPAGRAGEVYAFGQKTLMQSQSALDRINVRRLLINLRRQVKAIANSLLFEPNRASTLARFSSLVEPIMSNVQARQGVERYKVQIDTSTTTQNDVENNTIRGKIYLQPTKSVEFISLDFVVTNSID